MITILMATYNGEKYLAEQIESILQQTYCGWKLIIQDDCSTDHTPDIAEAYQKQYPEKIKFIRRETPSGSAKNNFFSMLSLVEDDYVMFCDQDDVWLPDKIEKTYYEMVRNEQELGKETPLLVHTDLYVTDEELHILSKSLFQLQDLSAKRDKLYQIAVQNIVSGCTAMLNVALLKFVVKDPRNAIMHDWWFAMIAAAFGKIVFLPLQTIYYRQHGANDVGAKNAHSLSYNWERFKDRLGSKITVRDTYLQTSEFLYFFKSQISNSNRKRLEVFASLSKHGKLKRMFLLCRFRFFKKGLFRKIGQIIFV